MEVETYLQGLVSISKVKQTFPFRDINGGEEKFQQGGDRRITVIATTNGPFSLFLGITKCEISQI